VQPPPQATPAPPPPTEQELREQLAAASRLKSESETALGRAQAAHDRAEHHVAKCRQRAASYVGLDDAIAASMVEALRCDAGRVSADLTEEQELAIGDREKARAELTAAENALNVFRAEYAQASSAHGDAARAVDMLIACVLATHAEAIAVEHEALGARAQMLRGVMISFDRFATPYGAPIPNVLRHVYTQIDRSAFARVTDTAAWRAAADALRADPQAEVTIALPEVQAKEAA
jgi:hypothetical protein